MDKKTYDVLMILIIVGVFFTVFNMGGSAYFELPGIIKAVGQTGPLILLCIIGFLIYQSYKKKG